MQYLDKGTYARVYYDKKKNVVVKDLELLAGNFIEGTSIADLAFHMSLSGLPGLPRVIDYKITDKKIRIQMPHYGRSLHEVGRTLTRKELAAVMVQLCDINQSLLDRGIMHIDIKPANILYKDDGQVTLIDFNLMSYRFWNHKTAEYEWISGVGTWCYCAPEIIIDKKPVDASLVWSLIMVWIECVLGHSVIHRDFFQKPGDSSRRKPWVKCVSALKKDCAEHYPVPGRHAAELSAEDYDLFCYFTQWDPDKRPGLSKMREIFAARAGGTEPPPLPPPPSPPSAPGRVPGIYEFCQKEFDGKYGYLYDRAIHYYQYAGARTKNTQGACLILALWLEGIYIFDDDALADTLTRHFGPRQELQKRAFDIGDIMDWRLYIPVDKPFILI